MTVTSLYRLCLILKDDVAFFRIGIFERSADLIKIVPANRLDNRGPGCNLVRRIWVGFHRLLQVLTRNDVKSSSGLAEGSVWSVICPTINDLIDYKPMAPRAAAQVGRA